MAQFDKQQIKAMAANKTTKKQNGLGMLPELVGFHIRLAQVAVFKNFADGLGELDITPTLFGVLVIIDSNPGLKQTELATAVQLDRSTVVSVIDKLERRDLVVRKRVAKDRRSNSLELTSAGRKLLKTIVPRVKEHEKQLCSNLSKEEQQTLLGLLSKVFPEYR